MHKSEGQARVRAASESCKVIFRARKFQTELERFRFSVYTYSVIQLVVPLRSFLIVFPCHSLNMFRDSFIFV